MTTLTRRPGSKYTAEQMEQAFTALALHNGSERGAKRLLEAEGLSIPHETLRDWKKRHAARLAEVEKRVEQQVWSQTSRKFRQIVDEAQDVSLDAIDAAKKAIASDDSKNASAWSNTAKNLTIVTGIGTEKSAAIDGRPMQHHDARGLPEVIRALQRHPGILKVVESTATEVEPSSLPASDTPGRTPTQEQKAG